MTGRAFAPPAFIPGVPDLPAPPRPGLSPDPEWFRTAVFYEALLRSFADSDGDGVGDFRGLASRLDYLAWLGVDAIWIPPFYPSPMRDGGYDISDYTEIDPRYGTMEDFRDLVHQAHERGIRIVIDIVLNHTSDAHPWFQASRSDPEGPFGDFYVWADDDSGYANTRIIFIDTEESNWSYDVERGQFFWHRFFSHQPDLNYDNPAVIEAVHDIIRFWARTGVDGFRLDAVPYLAEREARIARTCRTRTPSWRGSGRCSTTSSPARSHSRRPTSGRSMSWSTSAPPRPRSAPCASTSRSCRGSTTP